MESLPQAHHPRQGVVPFLTTRERAVRRTEVIARENLFGATGNEGLAAQLFDLIQSDEPMAWQQAEAVAMEMAYIVHVAITEFNRRAAAAKESRA